MKIERNVKIDTKASNMPSQDVWKLTPALTPNLQLITPSRASGTADHVRSLDDLLVSVIEI